MSIPARSQPQRLLHSLTPVLLPALTLLVSSACLLPVSAAQDDADARKEPPARGYLREREFSAAVKAADKSLRADPRNADELLYLKALALFYNKDFKECVQVSSQIIAEHADSDWYYKARFLKAQALVELKRFKEAEVIYEEEAKRLLSDDRKEEIANLVIGFADRLATRPDPNELDAPPPNFSKAYNLYGKVLQMEIGRELRDAVMFKRACAIQQAGNAQQAIGEFEAYLREFDPRWSGPAGTSVQETARLKENPPPPGKHIFEARYHLAEALRDVNQLPRSRWEARDLLSRLAKSKADVRDLQTDTRWLLITAFKMPRPSQDELERALKAVRDFLDEDRADPRAVKAAYTIPQAYETHHRYDQAVEAYQAFIDGETYELPAGDAAGAPIVPGGTESPVELQDRWQKEALYKIGQIRYAQQEFDAAIEAWQRYVSRFPNGPHWSASQNGILNAEFQQGVQALADKDYSAARQRFEVFLKKHPLDSRARQILFTFGQIHYAQALDLKENGGADKEVQEEFEQAIEEWNRLVSKYPGTEESSLALFRCGVIYEEELGDLEKALEAYRRLDWGSYASQARRRIADMTQKSLKLTTARKFRTTETPAVHLETRNIEKITVRTYRLNIEAYFRKVHAVRQVETLDVSLIEPDKTWDVEIDGYAKYKPLSQDIEIAFEDGAPGAMVVTVSEDDWEATTLVIRSDLDLIVKTSRRQALVFVQNMLENKPAAGVKVLLSDGDTVFATGRTGKDGVFTDTFDQLKDLGQAGVLVEANGHVASYNVDMSGLQFSSGLAPRGFIYTDRPAYRPGERVAVRGILRDVVKGSYAIPTEPFTVTVSDAQGRMLREEELALSGFGTFHTGFVLPESAGLGQYTVQARLERKRQPTLQYTGHFLVQHFKLEKIRLTLDLPRDVYFRGETVEGTVSAAYYWGEPLSNAPLRYELPDGRAYTTETDAEGTFHFTFDTSTMRPGLWLRFAATLTAENVSEEHRAFLARQGFQAEVTPSQPLVVAGEPVDVVIKTTGADGDPVGRDVKLSVLRRVSLERDRVLDMIPWLASPSAPPAEITVQEHEATTDPKTGTARLTIELPEGGDYILRVSGSDRFDQTVTAQADLKVSGDDDATRLRFFADSAELEVGEKAEVRLHSRLAPSLTLLTYEGEEILRYEVMEIGEGYNPIRFDVGHDFFPNVRIGAATMDDRELRTASKDFTVKRQLNVAIRPLKDSFLPGEHGRVELTVTDQLGKPVEAELSLALVNEALFAVHPDPSPPILDFFQADARRHAEFRVGATCGFSYRGTTREVVEEIAEEEERLGRRAEEAQRLGEVAANQAVFFEAVARAGGGGRQSVQYADELMRQAEAPAQREESDLRTLSGELRKRVAGVAAPTSAPVPSVPPRREVAGAGVWLPSIVTDKDGKAVVTLAMPETTTEWRLTARGCTAETLVGEATGKTLTRKDFFVEIKVPPMVRESDELRVTARVHNLADYEGAVALALDIRSEGDDDGTLAHREEEVQIKPQAGATAVFEGVKVPLRHALTVRVTARANDEEALRDTLELDIPISPWGMEYADHEGGAANVDRTVLLSLPDHKYTRRWLTVTVSPVIEEAVLSLALSPQPVLLSSPRSERFGYSPGSELLAAASALAYGRRSEETDRSLDRLLSKARRLAAELVASQRNDGGWSWHGAAGKTSDWPTTCRTYWALIATRDAGVEVDPNSIKKAAGYLQNRFRSLSANDHEGKAMVLHALSASKEADFASLNRLYRARNELGNAALAYTALAFGNAERPETAVELAGLLESRIKKAKEDGRPVGHWPHGAHHPYLQNDVEATALALLAFVRTKPQSEEARAAAEYLMQQRGCLGWNPMKARGPAVAALAAWFGQAADARSDYRVSVTVNDREIGTIDSGKTRLTETFEVPEDALVDGDNRISFKMKGRGRYAYAATLRGFSPEIKDPHTISYPRVQSRRYYHSQLEYRGRRIGVSSTSPVRHLEGGQRTEVLVDLYTHSYTGYLVVEEPLPAGTAFVEGSLSGDFSSYEVSRQKLTLYYQPNQYIHDYRYELVGYAPGDFRVPPTVIRDGLRPDRLNIGSIGNMAVLAPGESSEDPYKMNRAELFRLGQLHFNDGLYDEALKYLAELFRQDRDYNERDLARMLLWIYTTPEHYEASRVVEMFEILKERYPDLEIPYDRILVVGEAYRDIGEFERAWLVFRATINASFVTDSNVSAVLEDEGRFLGSVAYQNRLWREYPDSADVVSAYFAVSQALYNKAPEAAKMPEEDGKQPDRIDMLTDAVDILLQFMTLYPNDPLVDDAAFSLANAVLDLKNYPLVVELSERFRTRYTDSPMVSSFQYMEALGHFWQHHYEEALTAAVAVAEGDSKDKTFAQYIVAQIHHARNDPGKAIEWYEKVKERYPDAAQAIAYFKEKHVGMDEVSTFKPGEQVSFELDYRNIKEAYLQIYRVDLMKLYLQQKNLSNITSIHLAGISPDRELTIELGDGKDYADKTKTISLDLEDEGAYLVICRGDDLFTSGLILVTPLTMEVQENPDSGRVRVNVRNTVDDAYQAELHVKAIGSANTEFRSGETDLRGIFVADNIRGEVTVIARDAESRYAFYRGDTWLGAPEAQPVPAQVIPAQQPQMDYQMNLRTQNRAMQQINIQQYEQMRRAQQKGVKVKAAF